MINQEDLEFLKEAKSAFEEDITLASYSNELGTYLASRCGNDYESIEIYRVERVAYFNKQLDPLPF